MKKLLAVILSFVMSLAFTVPIFAEEEKSQSVSVIIQLSDDRETYILNEGESITIPIYQTPVQDGIALAAEVCTATLSINLVNDTKVEWQFIPLSGFYIPKGFTGITQTTDLRNGAVYAGKNYTNAMSGSSPVTLPAEFYMFGVYQTTGFSPKNIEINNYYG